MDRFRLRADRLRIVVIAVCIAAAAAIYYVLQKAKLSDPQLATDKTVIMGLAVILVTLSLALAWVLVRNLAKVLAERRHGVIGSRLRARLAFAFLFLVMVPCLLLFAGAILIVSQTLKNQTPQRMEEAIRAAGKVARWSHEDLEKRTGHLLEVLQEKLDGQLGGTSALQASRLEILRREYALSSIFFDDGETTVCAVMDMKGKRTAQKQELCSTSPSLLARARTSQLQVLDSGPLSYGWRAVAAGPVTTHDGNTGLLSVSLYIPDRISAQLDDVALEHKEVIDLRKRRPVITRLLVAIFTLLTLLVLFAAVWSGLFLARAITNPLMELASGTEALAKGDLTYRVPAEGNDEIAFLARSFNHMAAQIQGHRRDLVARQRYIETLLRSVPVGVISLDAGGEVTTANRAALEVLRVEKLAIGEPLGQSITQGRESVCAVIDPVLDATSSRVEAEVKIEADEGPVSIQVIAGRILVSEGEEGVLVVLEDLTSLRRAERFAAWGEVARRVAHEIKNPLTPIRLAAERMLRRYRQDPVAAKEAVEQGTVTIVREVDNLKNLVDEFSRFARLPEIHLEAGEIGDVVLEALDLYRDSHPDVEFVHRLAPDLPRHLFDGPAMRRCLINLLDNAVAAVGQAGIITATTRHHQAHDAVVVEILDDGPGLPEADRDKLFLPTFSRRPGGTGLGLAIVHRIVTEHGGQIRAEAGADAGTKMVIELPTAAGPGSLTDRGYES